MLGRHKTYNIFFGIVIIATCISCIPLIKTSSVPPINILNNNFFENDNEKILVLPIWQKYPFVMSESSISESSTLSLNEPLFLTVQDLPNLHNIIPSKTSAGMIIGPGGAIGRGVFFYGIMIISESGKLVWCKPNIDNSLLLKSHIFEKEKKELVRAFDEYSEIHPTDASNVLFTSNTWFFLDHMKLKIGYSSSDRNRIIKFLHRVDFVDKRIKPENILQKEISHDLHPFVPEIHDPPEIKDRSSIITCAQQLCQNRVEEKLGYSENYFFQEKSIWLIEQTETVQLSSKIFRKNAAGNQYYGVYYCTVTGTKIISFSLVKSYFAE